MSFKCGKQRCGRTSASIESFRRRKAGKEWLCVSAVYVTCSGRSFLSVVDVVLRTASAKFCLCTLYECRRVLLSAFQWHFRWFLCVLCDCDFVLFKPNSCLLSCRNCRRSLMPIHCLTVVCSPGPFDFLVRFVSYFWSVKDDNKVHF